ncbi:MAG: PIG-L deacetylase family protein [Patescibacteria group bacterium]
MTTQPKPNLLFVFAHPDDDAFGPSGTLIKMSKDFDIHFLCVTRGESGENHGKDKETPIAKIREKEVRASSKIIGAKSINFLDFRDGELCNNNYHDIARHIQKHIDLLQPEILMSWEPKGVTGHIDHIVVSMVTHYVFYKNPKIKKLMLYCLSSYQTKHFLDDYFIYRPQGYSPKDIDLVVDISNVWNQKIAAIKCHTSQIRDFQKIMNRPKIRLMEDCFVVLENKK